MTIPAFHDGLEALLGRIVFKDAIGFWNSVITDVTIENKDDEVAMRAYTHLCSRYLVSIYC